MTVMGEPLDLTEPMFSTEATDTAPKPILASDSNHGPSATFPQSRREKNHPVG